MQKKFLFLILCLTLFLTGCGNGAAATTAPPPPPTDLAPAPATQAPPTPTDIPPTAKPTVPSLPPLPPEAQRVEFQTEDGAALVGYYYPAAVNPAPAVVLMHWGIGDQTDWLYVGMVAWLQNRGAQIPTPPGQLPFDTPYPFPALPENQSFAVFTFDFRGFGESVGKQFENVDLDARAAYNTTAGLEGVDPARIVGIGGSIGANGVVEGCETCIGALSLSPGNYQEMYSQAVQVMDDDGKPVWCVAAEDDEPSLEACNAASGEHYQKQIYPVGDHAMMFFRVENNLQPLIETVILDFLKDTLGLP